MQLTFQEMKAARLVALGRSDVDTMRESGIRKTKFYDLKKTEKFKQVVQWFATEHAMLSIGNEADVEQSRADELALRDYIRPLAEETCGLVLDLVRDVRDRGVEDLSPRQIQGLMNSAVEAIECLRKGNDRISGLEVLLDELSKTQEVHAAKVVPLTVCHSTATDEGAS